MKDGSEVVDGEIRYAFEVVDSMAVPGPGANKRLLDRLEKRTDYLGASGAIDDRGHLLGTQYNEKAKDIPLRLLWTISNVEAFLSVVTLPEEPAGVGAQWVVREMLALYGIKMRQQATYTLVAYEGDELVLDVEFLRTGERRVHQFPEDESSLEVQSTEERAVGRLRLDLTTLGSSGDARGEIQTQVVFLEDGNREAGEIDESFEIRVRSTTRIQAPATQTD